MGEQVRPDERVEAHLDPLLIAERRRLAQDPVGDADLADVVEERAQLHGRDLIGAKTELPRDRDRVEHRRGGVALGGAVLRLERPKERADHREVRFLE